jgi:hypothetical protein
MKHGGVDERRGLREVESAENDPQITMLMAARIFLVFTAAILAVVGIAGLVMPDVVMQQLALAPRAAAGTAEIRALYGGGFTAWAALILVGMRNSPATRGLLLAIAVSMGAISLARLVSLAADYEPSFNIPACIFEALVALAAWYVHRQRTPTP